MGLANTRDLVVYELRDIYFAETEILKALPLLEKAASTPKLAEAFKHHRDETETQVDRLQTVFSELGETKAARPCAAMQGLLQEAHERIAEIGEGPLRDAALIMAAQKIEHYEIVAYGSLIALAKQADMPVVVEHLEAIEAQEKAADRTLNEIALNEVNAAMPH